MTSKNPGIYRRGRTYTAHIHWTDQNGKSHQHKKGGFKTLHEARKYQVLYLEQIHSGRRLGITHLKLGDFLLNEWLPQRKPDLKRTTYASYTNIINSHIIPHLGDVKLESLSARKAEHFFRQLQSPADGSGGLSPKSISNIAGVLKTALRDAVRWGLLAVNPVADARSPRKASPEMKAWQPHELRTFLEEARQDRQGAIWHLAATTGMRRGELLGLRWEDIDFDESTITIRSTRVRAGDQVVIDTPKTTKSRRTISVDKATLSALRRLKTQQTELRLALGDMWRNDLNHVAVESDGRPSHPLTFTRRFQAISRRAGLPVIRLHDLRHTYVVAARRAGTDIKTVSERIGHADTNVTLRVYDHVFREDDSKAADQTANFIYEQK